MKCLKLSLNVEAPWASLSNRYEATIIIIIIIVIIIVLKLSMSDKEMQIKYWEYKI